MAFASGKHAWGISDRSGFRYRLKDMKREWTGALVGPDEFEPKQPQLNPLRAGPDPQALRNPRPDKPEALKVYPGVPSVEAPKLQRVRMIGSVGQVSTTESTSSEVTGLDSTAAVGSSSVAVNISISLSGSSGTASVGSVTVSTP
mgnify:CR=1 FL=1